MGKSWAQRDGAEPFADGGGVAQARISSHRPALRRSSQAFGGRDSTTTNVHGKISVLQPALQVGKC